MDLSRDDLLAPILRDVRACSGLEVRVEHDHPVPGSSRSVTMIWTPGGSGVGVWIDDPNGLDDQQWRVADGIHEAVVEGLWSAGRSTAWPPCPQHPDTHPLEVSVHDHEVVWACPISGDRVAEVGSLTC